MANRPYTLPQQLVCTENQLKGGITIDLVKEFVNEHQRMFRRYDYLENLYAGFHDIFKQPDKEGWKPDNRLAVNFPKYLTDTFTGYGYGIPIKVSHPDETVNDTIQTFARDNEMSDHDAELIKICSIYGHGFEYIYQDEQARTKLSELTPKKVFVVYDDSLRPRAQFAVRYGYHSRKAYQPHEIYGEIMTRDYIQAFEGTTLLDPVPNPYGRIPVVEWRLNDERMGLYEGVAGLVEMYNHTLSEKGNDVDAFADAYLAILGAQVDEDQVYRIRDDRLINIYGTDDAKEILVQFLQKPTADGTQENLLNRLNDLIYQVSMVANISDETFGNATSGTALAYKLQAMSNLAKTFDRKIEKSLRKRYKLFCSLPTNCSDPEAYQDIEITFSRNLPKNLLEEAQTAQALEGVVSKETQLSVLSIVTDPKSEIERMDEEKQEAMDAYDLAGQAFQKVNPKDGDEDEANK